MNIEQVWFAIVGAVGGSGVIIVGLSIWLSKVWASRIEASTKAKYDREIKHLESSLELSRVQQVRNSEARFGLYSQVWIHLIDLQSAGENLWENASRVNLESFIAILKNARLAANRGRLILKEAHYQQLQETFRAFESYQIGKRRLIDLRSPGAMEQLYNDFGEQGIAAQIQENAQSKQKYETLMKEILTEFRQQLGLAP